MCDRIYKMCESEDKTHEYILILPVFMDTLNFFHVVYKLRMIDGFNGFNDDDDKNDAKVFMINRQYFH